MILSAGFGAQPGARAQDATPADARALGGRIANEVAELRGLPLKRAIDIGVYDLPALRSALIGKMAKEWPKERAARDGRAYDALGLIPGGYDLHERVVALLSEQIAGFYDPERKELRIIDRSKGPASGTGRSAARIRRDAEEDRMVMAHELVHALQDQHFDLGRLMGAKEGDDDRSLAVSALIEGDATLAMLCSDELPPPSLFASPKLLGATLTVLGGLAGFAGGSPELKKAPPILKETLTFPYLAGARFCLALGADGRGFPGIDAAFRDPPESTEQVLHPEKWFEPTRDRPVRLALPDLASQLDGPRARLASGTFGEFGTRILLEGALKSKAARAAAGWDGDRYELYAAAGLPDVLVWFTTWDSEQDADEFEAALGTWLKRLRPSWEETPADWAPLLLAGEDGRAEVIARRGADVALVLGARREHLVLAVRTVFEETQKSVAPGTGTTAAKETPR